MTQQKFEKEIEICKAELSKALLKYFNRRLGECSRLVSIDIKDSVYRKELMKEWDYYYYTLLNLKGKRRNWGAHG